MQEIARLGVNWLRVCNHLGIQDRSEEEIVKIIFYFDNYFCNKLTKDNENPKNCQCLPQMSSSKFKTTRYHLSLKNCKTARKHAVSGNDDTNATWEL